MHGERHGARWSAVVALALSLSPSGCRGLASYAEAPRDIALEAAWQDATPSTDGTQDESPARDGGYDLRDDLAWDFANDATDAKAGDASELARDAPKVPDLAVDAQEGDAAATQACDALFSNVPGYALCDVTPTSCRFYFYVAGANSCRALCGGQPCLAMEDNGIGQCDLEVPMLCGSGPCTCDSIIIDGICTCGR